MYVDCLYFPTCQSCAAVMVGKFKKAWSYPSDSRIERVGWKSPQNWNSRFLLAKWSHVHAPLPEWEAFADYGSVSRLGASVGRSGRLAWGAAGFDSAQRGAAREACV